MDLDHEKIPFIDERSPAREIVSHDTTPQNPRIFLENEVADLDSKADETQKLFNESSSAAQLLCPDVNSTISDLKDIANESDAIDGSMMACIKLHDNGNDSLPNQVESRKNSFKFPLQAAAEKGNVKTLERLLVKGDPLITDFKQRTPLHYACGFPYQKKALKMLDAILESPQAQNTPSDGLRKKRLIDHQDKKGETGLHIAARTGHRLVVEKLLFSAADVNLRDNNKVEPLEVIYSKVPAAMIPVFDGAVECKVGDPNDQNLIVRFDFGAIVGYPEIEKDLSVFQMETKLLSYCLQQSEQKRAAILLHPIVQVFLHLKWKKIRILLWISILYHVIWLLLYTLFIVELYLMQCPYRTLEENGTEWNSNETDPNPILAFNYDTDDENRTKGNANNSTMHVNALVCDTEKELHSSLNIKLGFLFCISISVALKELYEIYSTPQLKFYFCQLENVGQWVLIGVVGLTSIPVFVRDADDRIFIYSWQYQAAALGIFLAWSLILSQIGKIPRFGIYIEILGKVLQSFGMFMVTFASLLVAFTVAFQILMPEKVEFKSFPWGFIRVMVMMAGEIDYDEVFYSDEASTYIPFPTSTKLLYAAFVAVVTIILFNLLIGLTVSDTQGLQSVAQLTSLSNQLDQIYLMEKFIISKKIQRWLKILHKNHWLRYFLVTQQSDDLETNMGVDIHISKIPSNLQHQVREVAVPNVQQDNDEDDDDEQEDSIISKQDKHSDSDHEGASGKAIPTNATTDLKEQIRDILRELLDELKAANQNPHIGALK